MAAEAHLLPLAVGLASPDLPCRQPLAIHLVNSWLQLPHTFILLYLGEYALGTTAHSSLVDLFSNLQNLCIWGSIKGSSQKGGQGAVTLVGCIAKKHLQCFFSLHGGTVVEHTHQEKKAPFLFAGAVLQPRHSLLILSRNSWPWWIQSANLVWAASPLSANSLTWSPSMEKFP